MTREELAEQVSELRRLAHEIIDNHNLADALLSATAGRIKSQALVYTDGVALAHGVAALADRLRTELLYYAFSMDQLMDLEKGVETAHDAYLDLYGPHAEAECEFPRRKQFEIEQVLSANTGEILDAISMT
ncbi:hypothetical protein ACC806_03670 [Rhizobium ruizarguesonis]